MRELTACVLRAQAGDKDAFGMLCNEFRRNVISWLAKGGVTHDNLDDLCQNIFVRVRQKFHQLKKPQAFPYWLKTMTERMRINFFVSRRNGKEKFCLNGSETRGGLTETQKLVGRERDEFLHRAISFLQENDRQAINAFHFDGLTLKDIAENCSEPVGTIKRRLHLARKRLKTRLELMGYTHEPLH